MLTHRHATILGDIPNGWEAKPLRKLLNEHPSGDWGDDTGEQAVKVLRSTNFTDTGLLDFSDVATRFFTTPKAAVFSLKQDDLLLERSGGGPTQPVGRVGMVQSDLPGHWFSNFVQLLRPNCDEIDPEYLGWVLFELHRTGIVERLQHQTTQMRNLDFRDYIRVLVPRPPRPEQQTIAGALKTICDAAGAADSKLTAARRLKTALMQQLFTKGIPGRHTQFQETKIGNIPAEWDVIMLRQFAFVDSGLTLNPDRDPRNNARQYLTVVNVQRERLDMAEVRFLEMWDSEIPAMLLKEGDILAVEGHANSGEIGRAAIVTPEIEGMTFQNHLFRVRLLDGVTFNRRFLLGWLNSECVRRHWNATANTSSGLNTINRRGLRRLLIPKPKDDEQEQVAELLATADQNIAACERELVGVQRLKTSLLQNLLTGKVRVKPEVCHA